VPAHAAALVPTSRLDEGWWRQRFERLNELASRGGFDVMFVGDSITQGWEGAGKQEWDQKIAPFGAANFGISGDRTEHVLWRLTHGNLTGALDPKAIVVMLGTNNTGQRHDRPEEIAAGVAEVTRVLHRRFPRARILLFAVFPRAASASDPDRINNDATNRLLGHLGGHSGVRVIDINRRLLSTDGTLMTSVMPDLLHPNATGYAIWADALVPEIRAALN